MQDNSISGGFYYVATPYSKYPHGLEAAFHEACRVTAKLLRDGERVYCPIAHTHPVATAGDIDPLDHELWLAADRPLMDAATGLIVVKMPGWQDSRGVAAEIEVFRAAGKRIRYFDWSVTAPETILEEAQRITSGPRQRDY